MPRGTEATTEPSVGTIAAIDALTDTWARIEQAREMFALVAVQPEGSVTVQQYADRFNLPYATATNQLTSLLKQGKVQLIRGQQPDASGTMRRTNFYLPA